DTAGGCDYRWRSSRPRRRCLSVMRQDRNARDVERYGRAGRNQRFAPFEVDFDDRRSPSGCPEPQSSSARPEVKELVAGQTTRRAQFNPAVASHRGPHRVREVVERDALLAITVESNREFGYRF